MSARTAILLAITLNMLGCSRPDSSTERRDSDRSATVNSVYVVNYPLKYFARRIAPDEIDVVLPTPQGIDPALWRPAPEDVVAFQMADLIVLNGAQYAKWIENVSLPPARVVDTSVGFSDQLIEIEAAVPHRHGPEGAHSHGDVAFATWLDPMQAIAHAGAIRDALADRWPDDAETFETNFRSLEADLTRLDSLLQDAITGNREAALLASHPVYQYLARRYKLNIISVHWEPTDAPTDQRMAELRAILAEHPARIMLWEDTPTPQMHDQLQAIGIEPVVFAPCENAPADGDYLSNMKINARNLAKALDDR